MLAAVTAAYLLAAGRVTHLHPTQPWPRRHTVLFCLGMLTVLVATLGPVGSFDDDFFWAHMTQHILLMMLAAPLLLLGEPVLLVLRISSRQVRRTVILPVLHSRVVRFLTHPVVGWLVFAGVLYGTHFTGFFEYALEHPAVHDYVEHSLYLGAGLLYFYPLLGVSPGASAMQPFAKVVSLFTMMLPEAATGFAIYMASSVLYPFYEAVDDRPWGPSTALADQRLGGAFMWSSAMLFDAMWISVAVWGWLKAEEHKADADRRGEIAAGRVLSRILTLGRRTPRSSGGRCTMTSRIYCEREQAEVADGQVEQPHRARVVAGDTRRRSRCTSRRKSAPSTAAEHGVDPAHPADRHEGERAGHHRPRVPHHVHRDTAGRGDHGEHRDAGGRVVVPELHGQRPEVRRRPEEDHEEEQDGRPGDGPGHGRVADQHRHAAGGPAPHDVLRGPPLEPEGVAEDVEGDRGDRQARRHRVGGVPQQRGRHDAEHEPEHERRSRRHGRVLAATASGRSDVRRITASMSRSK